MTNRVYENSGITINENELHMCPVCEIRVFTKYHTKCD
jgi:hypothetical protein